MYLNFRAHSQPIKKIRRKSARMAQCRKHGAFARTWLNGNSARAKTAQTPRKNGAFQHQNQKTCLMFPKNGSCQKFQRQSDETLFR